MLPPGKLGNRRPVFPRCATRARGCRYTRALGHRVTMLKWAVKSGSERW